MAPDDQARYWLMPFPASANAQTMKLEGFYPNARYFSFVVYTTNADGTPAGAVGHRYDAVIQPDAGSINPFAQSAAAVSASNASKNAYNVCVTRNGATGANCTSKNVIKVDPSNNNMVWIALRIYVPGADKSLGGQALMGGQPLPKITVYGAGGAPQAKDACPKEIRAPEDRYGVSYYQSKSVNKLNDLRALFHYFFPPSSDIYTPSDYYVPAQERLWFAAPKAPPITLLPNPDNKYIIMQPGPYQPGRVIVIHGKAPTFPDTYNGVKPSGGFARSDVRYWSMCNNDLALPVGAVRCTIDQSAIIQGGYYTVVISDDLLRPDWLRPNINWLPWGDEQYPKIIFLRHLIPVEDPKDGKNPPVPFANAIQNVVVGCPTACEYPKAVVDFELPYVPPRTIIDAAGPYAVQNNGTVLMGDYYPVAAWCDKSTFTSGGWQACLKR